MRSLLLILTTLLVLRAHGVRNLRIASPLQSLTIWDKEAKEEARGTRRSRFLPRFKAGLEAEVNARRELAEQKKARLQRQAVVDPSSPDWAKQAQAVDGRLRKAEEALVEKAFDQAVAPFDAKDNASLVKEVRKKNPNKFQFVGVINSASKEKPITWYARKKPSNAKWSIRLVHVNRDAIVKDLFSRGKVDLFARYNNTGVKEEETNRPVIKSKYSVRERSWKNLWNFSPKHMFTDSSGSYWRERRLRPGLYTDGQTVYEASYRYRDGRNGMHRLSSFQQFLRSKTIPAKQKEKIVRRLKEDAPDIVLEE